MSTYVEVGDVVL